MMREFSILVQRLDLLTGPSVMGDLFDLVRSIGELFQVRDDYQNLKSDEVS